MRISNLKIGVRLTAAFAILLLLLIVVAAMGWSSLASAKAKADKIVLENNLKTSLANKMRGDLNTDARGMRNIIIYKDPEIRQQQEQSIKAANQRYDETYEKLGPLIKTEKGKQLYAELGELRTQTRPLIMQLRELVEAGKFDEAAAHLRDVVQVPQEKWFATLQNIIDILEKQNADEIEQMNADYQSTVTLLACISVVAVAIGAILASIITRSITLPINEAVKVAQTVAAGDLTSKIHAQTKDETGQLLRALKDMNGNLQNIVSQVRSGTDTIATASSQIASGNLDLSSRTEEQASALEETASSMEELTSTVKQNADNARQANTLAVSASDVATKGGAVVAQVVATMGSINESSKKIVDIIGVIDGIAFQTNILALNAAVEAARAGEQGRGFAVVATEVRNLAQRSAAAAKEIKSLIGDSVGKVETGSKLVDEAGTTMEEIVASIKRVTDIMEEITAASREQEAGIMQINQAITEMDSVTQQNAALVEQAAAAAGSLQDQAGHLAQAVSVFKLDGMQQMSAQMSVGKPQQGMPSTADNKLTLIKSPPNRVVAVNSSRLDKIANIRAGTNEEWEQF